MTPAETAERVRNPRDENMKLVNLTPHELVIVGEGGEIRLPASGQVARVSVTRTPSVAIAVGGVVVPVTTSVTGAVTGLPAAEAGVVLVVSAMVRSAVGAARPDVFSPGELIRGADGQPIGCRGLEGSL